jgi:hypothetical protein
MTKKTTLAQDLLKLRRLKTVSETKDKASKKARAEMEQWQHRCFERMEREETDSSKVRGIGFAKVSTVMAQVQDREAFIAWAKANQPELVVEKEFAAELNKLVRQCLDDNEPTPPGIGWRSRDYISVTGS